MSAFDNMLADMLKKALPPEVMELLSPEKINEFGEKINAYIVDTRERLTRIEQYQLDIIERIDDGRIKFVGYCTECERGKPDGNGAGSGSDTGSN